MKKIIKSLIIGFCTIGIGISISFAQSDISIIPVDGGNKAGEAVQTVSEGGQVWRNYRKIVDANELSLGEKFASGIISRDTILDYIVYLVKFLSGLALLIGAVAIIYLGYKKIALQYFGKQPPAFVMVIVGILVVTFAYVIIKFLRSAFIS